MKLAVRLFILLAVSAVATPSFAQIRTPWQQHDGLEVTVSNPLGLVPFSCAPAIHGDICE